jgi:hypothetical protein
LLILDNSCFAQLGDADTLARFRASLRTTDFAAVPSEINLLEASISPDYRQEKLFRTIAELENSRGLLPWPFRLLRSIGDAIAAGRPSTVETSGKEWYLQDLEATRELRSKLAAFRERVETSYLRFHTRTRDRLRAHMRERGIKDTFGSTRAFLEQYWWHGEMRQIWADVTWKHLKLPGDVPLARLEQSGPWRLYLDIEGVNTYWAVANQQPRFVGRMDLLQLVYLGLARRRIIATADQGFLEAATAVLAGRYLNARAVHISKLVS